MVPFDAVKPHLAGEEIAARDAGYPREVMEAGWVPEVVKLRRLHCYGEGRAAVEPQAAAGGRRRRG